MDVLQTGVMIGENRGSGASLLGKCTLKLSNEAHLS
jgi:hypothetical protein